MAGRTRSLPGRFGGLLFRQRRRSELTTRSSCAFLRGLREARVQHRGYFFCYLVRRVVKLSGLPLYEPLSGDDGWNRLNG